MAMLPCATLTVLATVLGLSTASAFSEFSGHGFPSATLHVSTLSDPPAGVILTTGVAHDHSGPVLDLARNGWTVHVVRQSLVGESLDV